MPCPHAIGWFCLCSAFGLAVAPMVQPRWVLFLLVVGFGAGIDVLWEIGEFLLMKSGSSGLQLTYENTIQGLALSFTGGIVAALACVTVLHPAPGTPRTLFGWSTGARWGSSLARRAGRSLIPAGARRASVA